MTRTLFSCGGGSIPRLKRETSSCRTPSCMKVRTRAVTSTSCAGTPHSAPTSSPLCAIAEAASNSRHANPVHNFMIVSDMKYRTKGVRNHGTKDQELVVHVAQELQIQDRSYANYKIPLVD